MEQLRKQYSDTIKVKIEQMITENSNSKGKLRSVVGRHSNRVNARKGRNKLRTKINDQQKHIETLKQKMVDIMNGKYDHEIKKPKPELHPPKEHEIKFHHNRFRISIDTLPKYIKKNLSDMPNNKGYIYKGTWFYGLKKPETKQPNVMFEKLRNGILRIHETSDTEYKVYEKSGKDMKQLVIHKKRMRRLNAPAVFIDV